MYTIDKLQEVRDKLSETQNNLPLSFTDIRNALKYKGSGGLQKLIARLVEVRMLNEIDLGNGRKGYKVTK